MTDDPLPANAAVPPTKRWLGDPLPRDGRLLAIDFGVRRLGFAISTPEQSIASPLETMSRINAAVDAARIRTLLEEYRVAGVVVGLPLHVGGEEGESASKARDFGAWVKQATGLPVDFWDERYSSAVADDWMLEADLSRHSRKSRRDMLAAQIILRSYLDRPQAKLASDETELEKDVSPEGEGGQGADRGR